jgi:hypothetical protein
VRDNSGRLGQCRAALEGAMALAIDTFGDEGSASSRMGPRRSAVRMDNRAISVSWERSVTVCSRSSIANSGIAASISSVRSSNRTVSYSSRFSDHARSSPRASCGRVSKFPISVFPGITYPPLIYGAAGRPDECPHPIATSYGSPGSPT